MELQRLRTDKKGNEKRVNRKRGNEETGKMTTVARARVKYEWHYVPRSPVTFDPTLTPSEHKMRHVSDPEVVKGRTGSSR